MLPPYNRKFGLDCELLSNCDLTIFETGSHETIPILKLIIIWETTSINYSYSIISICKSEVTFLLKFTFASAINKASQKPQKKVQALICWVKPFPNALNQ